MDAKKITLLNNIQQIADTINAVEAIESSELDKEKVEKFLKDATSDLEKYLDQYKAN